MAHTDKILERLTALHPKSIDLELHRIERVLERLGRPHDRLPPVIHVAGTNGKGSTIAFLRAMLEAAGQRVHVYTSPHLIYFRERIRLAGELVSEKALAGALEACEVANGGAPITFFEVTTAAAFKLFAETPADYLLLEVGLGGEFDATNVIAKPHGTIITPVSIDHVDYLGNTIAKIAAVKAGILKHGVPAVFAQQVPEALAVMIDKAEQLNANACVADKDYSFVADNEGWHFNDRDTEIELPRPNMVGAHQISNAATAIAAVRHFDLPVSTKAMREGIVSAYWPGRLSRLRGDLASVLPATAELWLDGCHNTAGAHALIGALESMPDHNEKPIVLICGMLTSKDAGSFFTNFAGRVAHIYTVPIPTVENAVDPSELAKIASKQGFESGAEGSIPQALKHAGDLYPDARIVICGSLYLAGTVLELDGSTLT